MKRGHIRRRDRADFPRPSVSLRVSRGHAEGDKMVEATRWGATRDGDIFVDSILLPMTCRIKLLLRKLIACMPAYTERSELF